MKINIVAGGPEALLPELTQYAKEGAMWVGVDRGVFYLLQRGIKPAIAFGDFDSVSEKELHLIENKVHQMQRFKPEKDETDMELALNWALEQGPAEILIFGATGGRQDHHFANVQLMIKPYLEKKSIPIFIMDKQNLLFIKGPGTYRVEKDSKKYVSFIPITLVVTNLTLEGFKFPLTGRYISIGSTLCISNELISDYGTFSFSEGILLVIRSDD
ncbi:thiamine diphosphokinase [Bacillus sp. MRMR6]|uniref:thiamine diphosphokinase n=1 Tax=Bacillus sp. MRMR6 TaxID=1928617 RepID=UPI0009532054|nr:thiamine diphosphokinase [Bacillus sp. MRMR6]OLS42062.1 thiamine diphosphokinase [Bacillus sp. MRMR6]